MSMMIVGTTAGYAGSSMYISIPLVNMEVHCFWICKQKLKELLVVLHLARKPAEFRLKP